MNFYEQINVKITNTFKSEVNVANLNVSDVFKYIIGENNPNSELILKARSCPENKNYYKELSKQVIWGLDSKNQLNKLVYVDVDVDPAEWKSVLKEDKYVYAIWNSFSNSGLGLLFYSDIIQNQVDYKQVYKSISKYLQNNYGIKTDNKCSNYNRHNTISLDSDFYQNSNFKPFDLELVDEEVEDKIKLKVDDSIQLDIDLYERLYEQFVEKESFYFRGILFDKIKNSYVKYTDDLVFDPSCHILQKNVDKDFIIQNCKLKNKNNTYGKSNTDLACVKLFIYKGLQIPYGKRAKTLYSILYRIIGCNLIDNKEITPNLIYTYLNIFNNFCVKIKTDKGVKPISYLLPVDELNTMAQDIYKNYANNKVKVNLERAKWAYTADFFKEYLTNNPNNTIKDSKTILLQERFRILSGNKKEFIQEIHNTYPGLSVEEYCEIISMEFELEKNSSYVYYHKYSNCSASDRTLNKIIQAYEYLVEKGEKPTQKAISEKTDISLITIKRYWKKVKK
jgi:hypothetical protein